MKKMLSLTLCLLMVMGIFVGCSELPEGLNGATIDIYLTEPIYDLDPARAYDDASLMKVIPLLFEGVTRINEKGKVENGITSDEEIYIDQRIIESLKKAGLIYDYEKREKYITFKYKNSQIRKCLTKAGNILELYCYLILREIKEENSGYYDDVDQSIYIDWDGIVHSDKDPKYKDTKNEVDIMVTRDLIPIFISCKNGEVHKEALYELDTISKKFGGKYGKKYLLATYLSSDKESVKYLKQRAKDMNITLIDNLNTKTRKEIKDKFIKSIK